MRLGTAYRIRDRLGPTPSLACDTNTKRPTCGTETFDQGVNLGVTANVWSAPSTLSHRPNEQHVPHALHRGRPRGTYAGRWSSTTNNGPSSYQQVSVTAGTTYTFSGCGNAPTTADAFTFEITVLWRAANPG